MIVNLINNTSLKRKLPIAIVGVAALSVIAAAISGVVLSSNALVDAAYDRLRAVEESKSDQITRYLASIEEDLRSSSASPAVIGAMTAFDAAFSEIGPDAEAVLQAAYISDNPFDLGRKDELDRASEDTPYNRIHEEYHPWFRTFLRQRGYYDIFLLNLEGDLVYSVFKELDYATNMEDGEWRRTDLANVWRGSVGAAPDQITFYDFAPYEPSYDAPASFISMPVYDGNDQVGVLAFQMPIDRINEIMGSRAGLGDNGGAYLVGSDGLLRSDSPLTEENDILVTEGAPAATQRGLDGDLGVLRTTGFLGEFSVTAFGPLDFHDTHFAVVTELPVSEALSAVNLIRSLTIGGVVLLVIVLTPLAYLLSNTIANPVLGLAGRMRGLAEGDTDSDVIGADRGDEIGRMAEAVEVFRRNAIVARDTEAAAEQQRTEYEEARTRQEALIKSQVGDVVAAAIAGDLGKRIDTSRLQGVLGQLGDQVNGMLDGVSGVLSDLETVLSAVSQGDLAKRCSTDLGGRYGEIALAANATADRLQDIAASLQTSSVAVDDAIGVISRATHELTDQSEAQSRRLDSTASAMQELTVTVRQNADNAKQAATRAETAHKGAQSGGEVLQETVAAIRSIRDSSGRIQEIVEIISDITFQTNLLALNASVEAARAGDAGRGFAVVAQEVRNLAQRSGQASRDIKELIDQSSNHVDRGVDLITKTDAALSAILSDVETVSALITEISSASTEQASGLEEVNDSVSGMEQMMHRSQSVVAETNTACGTLADQADGLKEQVRFFRS